MENPFIITGYIKPEYFCDRKMEAERIITKVTNGENIVLMAARRVGKSKLIDFCLESPTIKENFITISIDILRTSSIHEFTFELGKAVFEQAAHIIASSIENAVNVDIATLHTVKYHIIAADKKTIVCSYICNGG